MSAIEQVTFFIPLQKGISRKKFCRESTSLMCFIQQIFHGGQLEVPLTSLQLHLCQHKAADALES